MRIGERHSLTLLLLAVVCLQGCGGHDRLPSSGSTKSSLKEPRSADTLGPEGAVAVIRRYYEAIQARELPQAYRLWAGEGDASGQTFEDFEAGFAETSSVSVETGAPGRIEGAAGSRYIEVPVHITATTRDGRVQHFQGTYVLRRSVVDGASEEQRAWHIHSAELRKLK